MPAHTSTAGSLERAAVAQQARRVNGEELTDMLPPPASHPEQHSSRALQQLSLQAPNGGWMHDDADTTHYREAGGSDTPTSVEVEAALAEHEQLLAQNEALGQELCKLEDRAEASVVHMAQLRRVLAQLKKHKDAFMLAPDAKLGKAMAVIRSLGAEERAAADAAITAAPDMPAAANTHGQRRRLGKRQCMRPDEADAAAEVERYAEGAAKARAAAALSVSGGDPAQAMIHLLELYVRMKTQAPASTQDVRTA